MESPKRVMICERASEPVSVVSASGNKLPVLEGIFCQFGVVNVNERIYEEKEYLPHLEYLKKEISRGSLLGELDHPKDFIPQLNRASHKITHLEYIKEDRVLRGKVQLLNTDAGKNAQALLEGGVQLSISSRAAGTVGENKKVKINRIFTYDLVASPGFANAQLNQINESLGFDPNSPIQIFDMSHLSEQSEGDDESYKSDYTVMPNENPHQEYVTKEELQNMTNELTTLIQDKFKGISSLMESTETGVGNDVSNLSAEERMALLENKVHGLAQYVGHIVGKVQEIINESNVHESKLDAFVQWADDITVVHNKLEEYASLLGVNHNKMESFMNEEVVPSINNLESNINYVKDYVNESVRPRVNEIEEYLDTRVSTRINELASYLDNHVAPAINENEIETKLIGTYLDEASEFINNGIRYTERVAKDSNKILESVNERLKHQHDYLNYIGESTGKLYETFGVEAPDVKKFNSSRIDESNKIVVRSKPERLNQNVLSSKIDQLLESAKKQTVDRSLEERVRYFITSLDEANQREYLALTPAEKQKVDEAIINRKPITPEETIITIREARMDYAQHQDLWIREMPNEYKPLWESASDEVKSRITLQAKSYKFTNKNQIVDFWNSRKELNYAMGMAQLNESRNSYEQTDETQNVSPLGYSRNSIDYVAERLQKMNRGY